MGEIINFPEAPKKPRYGGVVECSKCHRKWGEFNNQLSNILCTTCNENSASYAFIYPADEKILAKCTCGSLLFTVAEKKIYCGKCCKSYNL